MGIELYPDRRAARIAMQEMKIDTSKHPLASSPNTCLYKSLADQNLGASIWTDADKVDGGNSGFGVYVTPAELAALARGESSKSDNTN